MLPFLVAVGAGLLAESATVAVGTAVATAVLTSQSSSDEPNIKSDTREISEDDIPKDLRGKI